jgi:heterodisulfide reductase subunit C
MPRQQPFKLLNTWRDLHNPSLKAGVSENQLLNLINYINKVPPDFGYTINQDRQIDYDRNDKKVIEYLNFTEPSIRICIACGSCTATCSSGQFVDFNIRRVHTLLRRGEFNQVKKEIEKCMFCGKCQLVCPRGVNLRNLILFINTAIEKFGL